MKKSFGFSHLALLIMSLNLSAATAFAMTGQTSQAYVQGYEDGFIYTAQQTGKGCKNRLSQAAVARLDQSVKGNLQTEGDKIINGGDDIGDGKLSDELQDYNTGKMHGMNDVLTAPSNGIDLCINGD